MSYQPVPSFADWGVQFDASVVDQYAERLRQAKKVASPEAQQKALKVATRYAAVDTGALEGLYTTDRGFTRTIATQSEFWQRALDLKGEQTKRSIQDALNAYEYVLDAVTGSAPITEKWVRELHAVVTEHQESFAVTVPIADQLIEEQRPLPHGEYKHLPNNPINRSTGRLYYYASPEETPAEMARFIDELRSEEFLGAHPVVQAAYAHYAYIRIHPFTDGNGRVARAVASVYLYRNPGVPLVIFADQRDQYIDSLEAADEGHPSAFVQFIAQRVIDAINVVTDSLGIEDEDDEMDLGQIAQATQGWFSKDLVRVARRLHVLCASRLDDEIEAKNLPSVLGVLVDPENMGTVSTPPGYVIPGPFAWINVSAVVDLPGSARHYFSHVVTATVEPGRAEFLIVPRDSDGVSLEVWRREIDPAETTSFRLRLDTWASRVARRFIKQLNGVLVQHDDTQ